MGDWTHVGTVRQVQTIKSVAVITQAIAIAIPRTDASEDPGEEAVDVLVDWVCSLVIWGFNLTIYSLQ